MNEILASLKVKSDKYQKPSIIGQLREFKEQQGMPLEKKEPSENKVLSEGNASGQQLKKENRDTER